MSRHSRGFLIAALASAFLIPAPAGAAEPKHNPQHIIHRFRGKDGADPLAALVADGAGNLYGTTYNGGAFGYSDGQTGAGTAFKIAPDGTQSVLHSFGGNVHDGAYPAGSVVLDGVGNIFGTTVGGGAEGNGLSLGTVFKITPDGTETVFYIFNDATNTGATPVAGLIMDSSGNLFGTTQSGGSGDGGTVFKLTPDATETVLYSFSQGADGAYPQTRLVEDGKGNLYGTTWGGGNPACKIGCGVVFEVKNDGTEVTLHGFNSDDGRNPQAGLILDKSGNLYGTAPFGGSANLGVIFKIAPDGTYSVLHNFSGNDGASPSGELIADGSGNLYGTTASGGANNLGALYKLAPDGTESVLFSFSRNRGYAPFGGLIADRKFHHLYGVTRAGGAKTVNDGVVFSFAQ